MNGETLIEQSVQKRIDQFPFKRFQQVIIVPDGASIEKKESITGFTWEISSPEKSVTLSLNFLEGFIVFWKDGNPTYIFFQEEDVPQELKGEVLTKNPEENWGLKIIFKKGKKCWKMTA